MDIWKFSIKKIHEYCSFVQFSLQSIIFSVKTKKFKKIKKKEETKPRSRAETSRNIPTNSIETKIEQREAYENHEIGVGVRSYSS